jgi:hypothetical protein
MKARANPVEVTFYTILEVGPPYETIDGLARELVIGDGQSDNQRVVATAAMMAREGPEVGGYWVIQEDGYTYLNPKHVFERKYTPVLGT